MGYLRQEQKTSQCIDEDGWLHSGDIGRKDSDGTCSSVGLLIVCLFVLSVCMLIMSSVGTVHVLSVLLCCTNNAPNDDTVSLDNFYDIINQTL